MKNEKWKDVGNRIQPRTAGLAACKKIIAQVARAREAIFAESRRALTAPERLLRLALNEAEAAAWQTGFPQLVFPVLATEKIQALTAWNAHQQSLWRDPVRFAPAA